MNVVIVRLRRPTVSAVFLRGPYLEISHISQHQGCGADVALGEAGEALFYSPYPTRPTLCPRLRRSHVGAHATSVDEVQFTDCMILSRHAKLGRHRLDQRCFLNVDQSCCSQAMRVETPSDQHENLRLRPRSQL